MKYNNIIVKYDNKKIEKMKRILSEFLEGYKNITFYVDTREQDTFLLNQFKKYKLKVEEKKLKYGDFGFWLPALQFGHDDCKCCYERKKDISEIIGNLNDDKDRFSFTRFEREIYNASAEGYDFKWVCGSGSWNDVKIGNYPAHKNKQGKEVKMNPKSLTGRIRSIETDLRYKLEFIPKQDMLFDICTFFYYHIRTHFLKYATAQDFNNIMKYNKDVKLSKKK